MVGFGDFRPCTMVTASTALTQVIVRPLRLARRHRLAVPWLGPAPAAAPRCTFDSSSVFLAPKIRDLLLQSLSAAPAPAKETQPEHH
jgi:hypothetical protein